MGNCCSRASDSVGLIPNEMYDKDHITYDKDFDPTKKPKIRIFHKGSNSSGSGLKKKEKHGRNPATGEKNPSVQTSPSPKTSKNNIHEETKLNSLNIQAFDNPSFEPSSPVKEVTNNSNENNNCEITREMPNSESQSMELEKDVTMRPKDKDILMNTRRPSSLPVDFGLPTLDEESIQISKLVRKQSGQLKKGKRIPLLPVLEFKIAKNTPSYENEFSPIVSDKIVIDNVTYAFNLADLVDVNGSNCIGSGGFGVVSKMLHNPSGCIMAVKRVQIRVDIGLKRELTAMEEGREIGSPYIVGYYGSLKHNGEVLIAMELMKISIDKIKTKVYDVKKQSIPEHIIKHISFCICSALCFLKHKLNIIHRDVKPSNMLVGEDGSVKICDFGISGPLVESRAKTKEIGCRPYMAPERLDPNITQYTVQSDVWSFGISMIELMTGVFPFAKFSSYFEQWNEIVRGAPPQLDSSICFSAVMRDFINPCLSKDSSIRPNYDTLLKSEFLKDYYFENGKQSMKDWMEQMEI